MRSLAFSLAPISGVAVDNSRELISLEHQSVVTYVIDLTEQETFDSRKYFCEIDLEGRKKKF